MEWVKKPEKKEGAMGPIAQKIEKKLQESLKIHVLEIINDSAKHQGHAGKPEGTETHFKVRIVAEDFEGMGRVERHRRVFGILQEYMENPIHALALVLKAPLEA